MPDLVKKFVAEGVMPNTEKIMNQGVFSRLETVFPPLTAAAWTALVSGAGSGTNGVPSLMVKHPGEELDHWHTSFDRNEVLCETLWDVAIKMGKKVALINWPVTFPMGMIKEEDGCQLAGSLNPPFRYFFMPLWDVASSACFSNKLLHCNQIPGRAVKLEPRPAEGWTNLPKSCRPYLEFEITVPPTYVEGYRMNVLMYASSEEGYDRMLISESKDAAAAITDIGMGEYGPWITKNFLARDYQRNGRFRFQILELSKDGKDFKLYQSSINMADPYSVPASLSKEVEKVAGTYMEVDDPWAFMDGWMNSDLYLEQLSFHADWWGKATKYVLENQEWDMAFSWVGTIDHIEHALYAGIEPTARVYSEKTAPFCWHMIREVYRQVDENIGRIMETVDLSNTYVVLISDHGMTHLDWNPFVKEHLSRAGLRPGQLDGVFITHEHSDHIKGLGVLARRKAIPIYGTKETLTQIKASKSLGEIPEELLRPILPDADFSIGDLKILPFSIDHDAANPVAYRVSEGRKSVAVATDMGHYSQYIIDHLQNLDALLVEANHDVRMLEAGPYPYPLKRRILSDFGHLSNENSGRLISTILHDGIRHIFLGHLSQENNIPELAYETVRLEIDQSDTEYQAKDFNISVARRDRMSEIITI